MPIRFRCAYCNQLMGIARRKAGTVVSCPKCTGQVVVPEPEGDDSDPVNLGPGQHPGGGLFEGSDFEKLFTQDAAPQMIPQPAKPQAGLAPVATMEEYDAVPIPGVGLPARGFFLSPMVLAILCGLIVVLLGMAFFLGVLVGRSG